MKKPGISAKQIRDVVSPYRVDRGWGKKFRLDDVDPGDTHGFESEKEASALLAQGIEELSRLQEKLYAADRQGVLLIFQAMDAAGKDGTIKHVMSGINPQGCQVTSFKAPSSLELNHDYLWRSQVAAPERGRIGIFNRSYYEEVLVTRVHPEVLAREKLPPALVTKNLWKERFQDIAAYERYLSRNGIVVRKFFLHLSKKEQKKRFLARLDTPKKHWKFSASDLAERERWDDYQDAYEEMIRHTATKEAPWYVVPADNKWFTRLVVAAAVVETLQSLDLQFPELTKEEAAKLAAARRVLERKG